MNTGCWFTALGVAVLQLTACVTAPVGNVDGGGGGFTKSAFLAEIEKSARVHESNGALRFALEEWFAVAAVVPGSPRAAAEIARLQQLISLRVASHQRAAKAALEKSQYADAQLRFLKVLALQPDNQEAIRALKRLEAGSGYARLASTPKVSYGSTRDYALENIAADDAPGNEYLNPRQARAPMQTAKGSDSAVTGEPGGQANLILARRYLSEKQYERALLHFRSALQNQEASQQDLNGYIGSTTALLVERHYASGVHAFRVADYDLAVKEFEKALGYDPQHQKARLYLKSSREMKARLQP